MVQEMSQESRLESVSQTVAPGLANLQHVDDYAEQQVPESGEIERGGG